MTNKEKALALINTFATGDTEKLLHFWQRATFSTTWHTAPAAMLSSAAWHGWLPRRLRPP